MGFYGNITNTSRTQFQFDKIYPNRYDMDNSKSVDGIYAGRYVLVEYDEATNLDTFIRAQRKVENGVVKFYYNPKGETTLNTLLTKAVIAAPTIIYTAKVETTPEGGYHAKDCIFYICTSDLIEGSQEPATFEETVNGDGLPNYTINYNIDTDRYGSGRGYDSTVWQKTYMDGIEKYIMIAELNTVVPTFDVAADAPTQRPLVPHFDTQSTDVYYKLHWQPTWGFRMKEVSSQLETNENNKDFQSSIDANDYPSDEKAYHYTYSFNPDTGVNEQNKEKEYDAAIFYNKAGFDKAYRTYYSSDKTIQNDKIGHYTDSILVVPTGQSGSEYNVHDGTSATHIDTDIQEMRILLPSLGNTISDIWDLIYGYTKKVNADETITYTTDRIRFRDIGWKDVVTGEEDMSLGGMTRDLDTLAGCINKVHDLMGMIITNRDDETQLNLEWFEKNYIYKDNGKYYRIYQYPLYKTISISDLDLEDSYPSDQEYNANYELAVKDLLQDREYYLILDNSTNNYKVKTLNEKAISALKDTDIIGYQTGEYGYEFVEIPDMPGKMATIYGLILQMKKLLEVENSETRDTATVTGAINTLNDIIEVFEDLVPGEFLICDVNGHVNSANWTTAQLFNYTNIGNTSAEADEIPVFNTAENRWISLSLDETNRLISLTHVFNEIQDTKTSSDKNDEQNQYVTATDIKYRGLNHSAGDTIDLYTPIVDDMGHVVGNNFETITLPYGYKTFTTIGNNTNATTDLDTTQDSVSTNGDIVTAGVAVGASNTVASKTQDSLAINPHNKWLQVKITDDNITLAHEIHGIQTNPLKSDLNNNGDTIAFQDLEFDTAGHVTKNQKHTYTLPYSFKTVTPATQSTAVTNPNVNTITIIADNTQDALTVASTNKWIRMSASDSNDTLSIGHEVHAFESGTSNTKYGLQADISVEDLDADNTFEVPVFKFDEAGHITMAETHTVTIPENFDKIAVTVTGQENVAVNASSTAATIEADNLTDTITLDVGNRWIQLVGNASNDKISIYHAAPGAKTNTTQTGNETPNYGNAFKIPEVKYDEAGHISGVSTHTVTFPTPNLNDLTATDASVLTGIKMVDGTLAITQTNANVGTRKLTDYELGNNNADVAATDTINAAFGKLQVQMHDEESNRATAITNLNNSLTTAINNETTARESDVKTLQDNIDAEVTARTNAINALDYSSAAVSGQYVSEVTQTNGKISVTRTALPDYSTYWTQISTLQSTVESQAETIATLQSTIDSLITRIETLEGYHSTETTT